MPLICPFKLACEVGFKDCVEEKCAIWVPPYTEFYDYINATFLVEGHCSFKVDPHKKKQ